MVLYLIPPIYLFATYPGNEESTTNNSSNDNDVSSNNGVIQDITPLIEWEFAEGYEDVERVDLFISELPQGQGLHPWDTDVENITDIEP